MGFPHCKKISWNLSAPQSHVRNMNFSLVAWSLLKRRYGPGPWVILLSCCIPGVLGSWNEASGPNLVDGQEGDMGLAQI